jgi:hypothetical protein
MRLKWLAPVVLIGWVGMTGCSRMPYGLEHAKVIEAAPLASEILAWEKRGAKTSELPLLEFTNSRIRRTLCPTNVVIQGISYEVILTLDCKSFQGKGNLLGARNGAVLWAGINRTYEVVHKGNQGGPK